MNLILKAFHIFFLFQGFALLFTPSYAQSPEAEQDSLLYYDLEEIVVSSGNVFGVEANTISRVSIAELERHNATSVSELARTIPAAHIQTNSRGESLIYVRNAGERQVALFFNGALLNIPWDNRVNLDLVPASVIGGITVSKGVPSVLYGTNVLGGAINITSRVTEAEGSITELSGFYGGHSTANIAATHLSALNHWKFGAAVGYSNREGIPLPRNADLPFNQQSGDIRTNTDREVLNIYSQISHDFSNGTELGLSYLFLDGDFGIAPESHLDPSESSIRYWRYPHWRNSTLVLNGLIPLGSQAILKGAIWNNWYEQEISSFGSADYLTLEESQKDRDQTVGTRLSFIQPIGDGELIVALNGLHSEHEEVSYEVDAAVESGEALSPPEVFSQFVYSAGVEYGVRVQDTYKISVGGSLDGITTPETGDKPSLDPFLDYGLSGGAQVLLSDNWLLRGALGRKVRFPTMRELFGVALNRFLLNPDLSPESSFVTEIGLSRKGDFFSGEIIGFYQRTFDTIDQRRVEVDGNSLRQRVNLEGSRVWGVESVFSGKLVANLILEGHLTWTNPRGFEEGNTVFLTEKPEWLGSLSVGYNKASGFSFFSSVGYRGDAYGLSEANEFVTLKSAIVIDTKLSYRFVVNSIFGEWYVRVDNIFDSTTLPQLGLPGAGRLVRSGLNISL